MALSERAVVGHAASPTLKEFSTMLPGVPRLALRHAGVMLATKMRELDDKL
jgi:hypothetical protein